MMAILKKIERAILGVESFILIAVGITLPSIVVLGVIFRYILKTDLFGIEEIEIFMAICLYFVGGAYASYLRTQITADLVQSLVKSFAVRKFFGILACGLSVVALVAFTYWTIDLVDYAWLRKPRTPAWKIPLVVEYIVVLISFVLMTIYAFRDLWLAIVRKPETASPSLEQS